MSLKRCVNEQWQILSNNKPILSNVLKTDRLIKLTLATQKADDASESPSQSSNTLSCRQQQNSLGSVAEILYSITDDIALATVDFHRLITESGTICNQLLQAAAVLNNNIYDDRHRATCKKSRTAQITGECRFDHPKEPVLCTKLTRSTSKKDRSTNTSASKSSDTPQSHNRRISQIQDSDLWGPGQIHSNCGYGPNRFRHV